MGMKPYGAHSSGALKPGNDRAISAPLESYEANPYDWEATAAFSGQRSISCSTSVKRWRNSSRKAR